MTLTEIKATTTATATTTEKIRCELCATGGVSPVPLFEQLGHHIKTTHFMNVVQYKALYPTAPTMTAKVMANLRKAQAQHVIHAANRAANSDSTKATAVTVPMSASTTPRQLKFGLAVLTIREDMPPYDAQFIPVHDDNYQFNNVHLETLALSLSAGENVLMVGPTGAGKTTMVEELAVLINQPVRKVSLNSDTRVADFLGEKVVEVDPVSGQAVVLWKNGILPDAMIHGHWLILDEADAMPPGIAFALQAVLEERPKRNLMLAADSGRVIEAAATFRIIATANTIGKGDDSGMYTGTQVMNEAWLDRFTTTMLVSYLPPAQETKVLIDKGKVNSVIAAKMVECAKLVRGGLEREECFCTFSTRRLISWARKTTAMGGRHWQAAVITIFNKLTKDDRQYVEGIVQRLMGRP